MLKLEEIINEDNGLYTSYGVRNKKGEFTPVCDIKRSVEVTMDVSMRFAEWVTSAEINGQHYEYTSNNIWHGSYNPDTRNYNPMTTQELFEIFINNHYGKQSNTGC